MLVATIRETMDGRYTMTKGSRSETTHLGCMSQAMDAVKATAKLQGHRVCEVRVFPWRVSVPRVQILRIK